MKRILFLGAVLVQVAQAAQPAFDLKMNVELNGQPVSAPHVVTVAGERSSVTQKGPNGATFIEVIAREAMSGGGIAMDFKVGTINDDGTRTILSTPQIIAIENEEAEIEVGQAGGPTTVNLKVVAKRTKL